MMNKIKEFFKNMFGDKTIEEDPVEEVKETVEEKKKEERKPEEDPSETKTTGVEE